MTPWCATRRVAHHTRATHVQAAAASEPRPSDLLKAAVDSVVAASGGSLARDRATALVLVKQLFLQWSGPVETLSRAGALLFLRRAHGCGCCWRACACVCCSC